MKALAIIPFVFAIISLYSCKNKETEPSIVELKHGINISYWLSQNPSKDKHREWFTQQDVAFLDSLGFDHLRIPLDEEHLFDEHLIPQERGFYLLRQAIAWCAKHNMRVIADLHTIRSHTFSEDGNPLFTDTLEQSRFYKMWEILSDSLRSYPNDLVAYEVLNEPVAENSQQWNRILRHAIEILRAREPERTLLIGSNLWQRCSTVKELYIPVNDPNILVTVHYYEPMPLTHYGCTFSAVGRYTGAIHYPGKMLHEEDIAAMPDSLQQEFWWIRESFDKSRIESEIQEAVAVAARYGLKVYCSEFGIFHQVPYADRERWYTDVTDVFEKYGIGYANWEYKGGFGVIDSGKVVSYMVQKLTPKESF